MGQAVYLGLCLLGCLIFNPLVKGDTNDTVAAKSPCPEGVLFYRSNCYEYFSSAIPWHSAEEECQNLEEGGHLATIEGSVEANLLASYLRRRSGGSSVWTGLHAVSYRRGLRWGWSSGAPYDSRASFWNGWRPSQYSAECVSFSPSGSPRWNQYDCTVCLPYVCKYRAFY
ncbi:regenerating islet-derived protein 4-like [Eublepharis macularius]|uniref:Regenerating islet-derived protein 4-like n=1 Tax=Eublepharis macularius TaxID=481883 RepID=A0AA97JUR7_EUBMA|nr:regenerating islet-derived protein 4-like [Eublepharis macularius]